MFLTIESNVVLKKRKKKQIDNPIIVSDKLPTKQLKKVLKYESGFNPTICRQDKL